RFGLGGEMPLLIRMKVRPPVAISGIGTAPALATIGYYRTRAAEPWEKPEKFAPIPGQGIRSAIVPGVFDGLILALRQYGTMSFAQVAAPAIEYADGFPIAEEFAGMLRSYRPMLERWPVSMNFFLPAGEPPQPGDIVRMPPLAATLRELAAVEKKTRGKRDRKLQAVRDWFYKGGLARRMAAFSEANGGLIRYDDLAQFRAEQDQPRSVDFMGHTVHKPGFWTQGPVMLQALQILSGYDLKAMGHNSPEYLHTVIEAVKLAFADRDRYYGDPKFSTIDEATLLSPEYAAARRKLIDPRHASREHRPGDFGPPLDLRSAPSGISGAQDTTCVNVVDRAGNAFSATPSGAWLPSVIAGDTGIPFTSRLQSFVLTPGHPNQLAPRKRPRVTLSPTLITRNGELAMVMSTPGGDNQDQAMLQALLNMLVFGMGPQEAVEAPRFQSEHFYSSFAFHEFTPAKVNLEGRIPAETVERLRALGHDVTHARPWSNSSSPTVILLRDEVLHGGADPRRARFIFGR
ncbi:MAG TPA: gamma-glutamyltransferase, partial [Bryobacteraceae bacterium]|nr:gamma-glutamyltransferase [Bryobacteraceae bacterium]